MNIKNEFIPYEQALALKELGFDEPCFGFYTEEYKSLIKNFCKYPINLPTKPFLAPTYSQAFRWFRDKYNLCIVIKPIDDKKLELGYNLTKNGLIIRAYTTYEEAELACLKKLIEIVKGGNNE